MRKAKIAILGHVGASNLGDEAIIESVRRNLARLAPGVELIGITTNPPDTQQRHGLPTLPLRRQVPRHRWRPEHAEEAPEAAPGLARRIWRALARNPIAGPVVRPLRDAVGATAKGLRGLPAELGFLGRSYRELRGVDLIVVAGSNQLMDDWGGPAGFPYTLFKWALLARATGARVCYVSVGANPLGSPLSRLLLSVATRTADYRSYRDPGSKQLAEQLTNVRADPVVPDLVFSLPVDPVEPAEPRAAQRVLINLMTLFDDSVDPVASRDVFERYLDAIAEFTMWLEQRGFRVELFHTQAITDVPAVAGLEAARRARGAQTPVVEHAPQSPQEAIALIRGAAYVVATRFHAILFALLALRPALGLAYGRKARELMEGLGQGAGSIAVADCTFEVLRDRFVRLERERDARVAELRRRLPERRETLERQYERILALLPDGAVPAAAGSGDARVGHLDRGAA